MVKAEDAPASADGWTEVFSRNRSVPPPGQTVRLAADSHLTQSRGFQLCLSRVLASHLSQVTSQILRVHVDTVLVLTQLQRRASETGSQLRVFREENVANTDFQSSIIQGELEFCVGCQNKMLLNIEFREIIHQTPPVIYSRLPLRPCLPSHTRINSLKVTSKVFDVTFRKVKILYCL